MHRRVEACIAPAFCLPAWQALTDCLCHLAPLHLSISFPSVSCDMEAPMLRQGAATSSAASAKASSTPRLGSSQVLPQP